MTTVPSATASTPAAHTMEHHGFFCPHCGYDLRGSVAIREDCPECGKAFDRIALVKSQIPWLHRRDIGRIRAFWKTAWHITFRHNRVGYEAVHPPDLPASLRFRAAVVAWLMAWITPRGLAPLFASTWTDSGDWGLLAPYAWACVLAWSALVVLALYAVTGVHTYWYHPKSIPVERQNRAIALGYYACAPMAFVPAAVPLGFLGALLLEWDRTREALPFWLGSIAYGVAWLLAGFFVFMWWGACVSIARQLTQPSTARLWLMSVFVPLTWLLSAIGIAVVVPAVLAYAALMLLTL